MSCIHCDVSREACDLMSDWDENKASPVAVIEIDTCGVETDDYKPEDCDFYEEVV